MIDSLEKVKQSVAKNKQNIPNKEHDRIMVKNKNE